MDGLDVTRALRKHSNVPIIMLTARVEETRQADRPRARRRRLSDQAVQPAGARGARPRGVPARRPRRRTRRRRPRSRRDARRAADAGTNRRHARIDLTDDGVRAARDADAAAGAGFHARPAARRDPRRGGRIVRPRHRCAHQEPAQEAGARSAQPAIRAHRLRRRLQVRRHDAARLAAATSRTPRLARALRFRRAAVVARHRARRSPLSVSS